MAKTKYTNVFFDIETLKTNKKAKNPKDWICREYSVSMEVKVGKKYKTKLFANLKDMLNYLINDMSNKKFKLIAHNGRRFDFNYLERTLIDDFGLKPKTGYNDKYKEHLDTEVKESQLDKYPYFLLEYRVKAKTSLDLAFQLTGKKGTKIFVTEDSYPHFQAPIKTLGEMLVLKGLLPAGKLPYEDYEKFDRDEKMSPEEVRAYCQHVFDNELDDYDKEYVHNDTTVLRVAWDNYKKLFTDDFDIGLPTLSLNILKVYTINALAKYQLTRKIRNEGNKQDTNVSLSSFFFKPAKEIDEKELAKRKKIGEDEVGDGNLFRYIHRFYHGGLNFYNYELLGKTVHDLVHMDINSSYPTVMHNMKIPTQLIGYVDKPGTVVLDKDKYYFLQVPADWVMKILKKIPSKIYKRMTIKRHPTTQGYVFLQTPDIMAFSDALHEEIKSLPVKAALIFSAVYFGGRKVIEEMYTKKTKAKKEHWPKDAVYVIKVILNGLYGIPALRSNFNVYKYIDGELTMCKNGLVNTQRNIIFAAAITSYAYRNLLLPLTYNLKDLDKGYVYTDTDSHFLTTEYWETIKDRVNVHPTDLGAWDLEHKHIKSMTVLNHKKYCLLNDNDEIEVYSGGIPHKAFNTKLPYDEFVKTQFSDGVVLESLKNTFTRDNVVCLYIAKTKLSVGDANYHEEYSDELEYERDFYLRLVYNDYVHNDGLDNDNDNEPLFYDTPVGAIGASEILAMEYTNNCKHCLPIKALVNIEKEVFDEIN